MRGRPAFLISVRKLAPGAVTPTPRCAASATSDASPSAAQTASHREQLELGPGGHQSLGRVEYVDDVGAVRGDDRGTDTGPAVQILAAGLRGGDVESALQFGDQGSDGRPLLLERPHVTEQQVELEPTDPHDGSGRRRRDGGTHRGSN